MGSFDTVHWRCPHCGAETDHQTKAGSCSGKNYSITSVPLSIAESLSGQKFTCIECSKSYSLRSPKTRINMEFDNEEKDYD